MQSRRFSAQRTTSSRMSPKTTPRLRRGFKSEADQWARDFRNELGLRLDDPLSPWVLAEHLAIPLHRLRELRQQLPEEVAFLTNSGAKEFSAATLFFETRRRIIHNDGHHPRRQASDIAHELAHAILGHPPTPPLSDDGCRNFDPELEAEANWLGPALLISREAALAIVQRGLSLEAAGEEYGVSKPVVRMRVNLTGAKRIVARARATRRMRQP